MLKVRERCKGGEEESPYGLICFQANSSINTFSVPIVLFQFEQLRRSVVLTSNFAKSVVNLADVVSMEHLPSTVMPPPQRIRVVEAGESLWDSASQETPPSPGYD